MNYFQIAVITLILLVSGRAASGPTVNDYIRAEVTNHNNIANTIQLGSHISDTLPRLQATQYYNIPGVDHRNPERFMNDGKSIEIFYFRSAWYSDGLLTDDEFTPYVFVDGILSAVGWTALGGPKTRYNAAAVENNRRQNQKNWDLIDRCSAELLAGTRTLSDGCF